MTGAIVAMLANVADNAVVDPAIAADANVVDPNAPIGDVTVTLMSSFEFWLSALLIVGGLLVIAMQLYLATRRDASGERGGSIEGAIGLSIVSLIIVGALVLIAAGYSKDQIAPAMGLFGTIAGYLVGRQDRSGGK